MNVTELVQDMRRVRRSMNNTRMKRKRETKDDYVKRKLRYRCTYCRKKNKKSDLNVSIEPYHLLKEGESLSSVIDYYHTSKVELERLNPDIILEGIKKGDFINVPSVFRIYPNTHGICYCDRCKRERSKLGMNHIDYLQFVINNRKLTRSGLTKEKKEQVKKKDNYECIYCEIEFKKQKKNPILTIDHLEPIISGGTNDEDNLGTACLYHNNDKGTMGYDEYVKKIKKRSFEENLFRK